MNTEDVKERVCDKKCHVQIMEELLTNNQLWKIDDETFQKTRREYHLCLKLLWIEEKFNIVSENFYEWEKEIKESYDFFIENQSDNPCCNIIMEEHGIKEIIILNRRLFNVLNSIRMYRDQILHDLSSLDSQMKIQFEEETNRQYDKTFSYQIMEFLRNYMQHQGLVIERISVIIPFFKKVNDELCYFAEADYSMIEGIEKYKQKIKCPPNEKITWLNLIVTMREYYSQIVELHSYFRKITHERYCQSIKNIHQAVKGVYKDLPVRTVAFYGKEEQGDFLLQMSNIDRLQRYRENVAELDVKQHYISKKLFLESEKIRISNSVMRRYRYSK